MRMTHQTTASEFIWNCNTNKEKITKKNETETDINENNKELNGNFQWSSIQSIDIKGEHISLTGLSNEKRMTNHPIYIVCKRNGKEIKCRM